jgi:hypothetical protein
LQEKALDRTKWNCFGRGFGPVVWQITDDGDDILSSLKIKLEASVYNCSNKNIVFWYSLCKYFLFLYK